MTFVNFVCRYIKVKVAAVLQGTLAVTGAITGASTLAITGATTLTGATTASSIALANFTVANHGYASAHADWTLSSAENKATVLTTTDDSADAGAAAIATPTAGKIFIVRNTCGQILTVKASGQTGIAVANDRSAIIMGNGTDFVRITPDATF